jgi:hypothetical protein
MEEHWIRWEPISNLQKKYYIEALCDSIQGFKVILFEMSNKNNKILIHFKDSVWAYRYAEEIVRCNLVYELGEKYGKEFFTDWTFYKVENSEYSKWATKQSLGIIEDWGLQHFCIAGLDSVLDIINVAEPKVTILNPSEYTVGATFTFENVNEYE